MKQKIDHQDMIQTATSANVRSTKEQQSVMNEKLDQHTESLVRV